jgi:hypothetical protein
MDDGFMLTVGRDGLIYAAGYDGYLCVVDPNGNELSRFQSDGWLTPPVISADNTIIVSDASNRILAIGGEGCEEQVSVLHRPYDLNGSRDINFLDFALLAADWLACNDPFPPLPDEPSSAPCAASWDGTYFTGDIDRNLHVDYTDLVAIANRWLGEE